MRCLRNAIPGGLGSSTVCTSLRLLVCCLGEESWILAKLVPYVVLVRTPEYTITYCMKYEVLRYTVDAQACKVYTYEY